MDIWWDISPIMNIKTENSKKRENPNGFTFSGKKRLKIPPTTPA
jgi:hypothetical protein